MNENFRRDDIPLEHQLVLRSSAVILQRDFDGMFGAETIERFLITSYDEFAGRVTVTKYLPTFAERFARERLSALSRVEGLSDDHRPTVLFLCTHNAGRSQMAAAYLTHLAGDRVEVRSAGSAPADAVNPAVVEALLEEGIDIRRETPKVLTDKAVFESDVVITMGCGDVCPVYPGKRYEDWALEDPAGQGVAAVRPIRDDIRRRVEELIAEIAPVEAAS